MRTCMSALVEHTVKEDHWVTWRDASIMNQHVSRPTLILHCRVMVHKQSF